MNLFWLFLILRIAYRFVASWGEVVKDERSDYEESENEQEAQEKAANGKAAESAPQVLLNGEPVSPVKDKASSTATAPVANGKQRKGR